MHKTLNCHLQSTNLKDNNITVYLTYSFTNTVSSLYYSYAPERNNTATQRNLLGKSNVHIKALDIVLACLFEWYQLDVFVGLIIARYPVSEYALHTLLCSSNTDSTMYSQTVLWPTHTNKTNGHVHFQPNNGNLNVLIALYTSHNTCRPRIK